MHFGDAFERLTPGGQISRQGATIFAGQLTQQLTLRPTGLIAVLGVRFHPFGAASFLDTPQHRLAGLTPGIDEIAPALARALDGVRDETDDVRIAVPLVQTVLEKWAGTREPDQRLQIATRAIVQSGGAISIDRLADRLSVTRRHLERRFLEGIGISPKRLARITRFQRAVRVLGGGGSPQTRRHHRGHLRLRRPVPLHPGVPAARRLFSGGASAEARGNDRVFCQELGGRGPTRLVVTAVAEGAADPLGSERRLVVGNAVVSEQQILAVEMIGAHHVTTARGGLDSRTARSSWRLVE